MIPGIGFIDSGELAAACCTLSIIHPTGYPVFSNIGFFASGFPLFHRPITNLNAMCCFFCATAMFFFGLMLVTHFTADRPDNQSKQFFHQILGMIAFGTVPFVTKAAFELEVHSLQILLVILVWYFYLQLASTPKTTVLSLRQISAAALGIGLSTANHGTSILLIPGLVFILVSLRRKLTGTHYTCLALFFLAGVSCYIFLPIRSASGALFNWSNPGEFPGFVKHLTAWQYRIWMFESVELMTSNLRKFLLSIPGNFGILLLGIPFVFQRFKTIPRLKTMLMALTLIIGLVYIPNYNIPDLDPYYFMVNFILLIFCFEGLFHCFDRYFKPKQGIIILSMVLMLQGGVFLSRTSRRGIESTEVYARQVASLLEPGSMLVSRQWDMLISPLLYLQHVEQFRPDLVIIDRNLLRRSWYLDQIQRIHPALFVMCGNELKEFRFHLQLFEAGKPYDEDKIQAAYESLIHRMIAEHPKPRYITFDVLDLTRSLIGFDLVPKALIIGIDHAATTTQPLKIKDFMPSIPDRILGEDLPEKLRSKYYGQEFRMYSIFLQQHGFFGDAQIWLEAADSFN